MYLKQFAANGDTLIILNGNPASQVCNDGSARQLSYFFSLESNITTTINIARLS